MPDENLIPDSGTIELNPRNPELNTPKEEDKAIEPEPIPQTSQNVITEESQSEPEEMQENIPVDESYNNIPPVDSSNTYSEGVGRMSPKTLAIAAIISGLLVISGGYVMYKYFSQLESPELTSITDVKVQETNIDDSEGISESDGRITSGVSTSRAEIGPRPTDDFYGIAQTKESPPRQTADTAPEPEEVREPEQREVSEPTDSGIVSSIPSRWVANDYKPGDIRTGNYTVVSGDTLWEIAEAAYGNGSEWHGLANANDVPNLANGNPLILPGQILNIPA